MIAVRLRRMRESLFRLAANKTAALPRMPALTIWRLAFLANRPRSHQFRLRFLECERTGRLECEQDRPKRLTEVIKTVLAITLAGGPFKPFFGLSGAVLAGKLGGLGNSETPRLLRSKLQSGKVQDHSSRKGRD